MRGKIPRIGSSSSDGLASRQLFEVTMVYYIRKILEVLIQILNKSVRLNLETYLTYILLRGVSIYLKMY